MEHLLNDFYIEEGTLISMEEPGLEKLKNSGVLEIPEGIIEINLDKDYKFPNIIKTLHLPSSLKAIGGFSFNGLKIKEIYGGENVEEIGAYAFYRNNLKNVEVFKNLKVIRDKAFEGNFIENFYFNPELKEIGEGAFRENSFKKLDFRDIENLKIKDEAFASNLIEEIVFPKGGDIDKNSFSYNYITTEVHEGKKAGFSDIWTPEDFILINHEIVGLTPLGEEKIKGKTSITIPTIKGATKISNNISPVFKNMYEVYICEGYTEIDPETFKDSKIRSIHLPDSLRRIGYQAFKGSNIEYITLPKNLADLGVGAFEESSIVGIDMKNTKIKSINKHTFSRCHRLQFVDLPKTLENIYGYGFFSTSVLREISLPKNLEFIGESAFAFSGLRKAEVPDGSSLEVIDLGAFSDTKLQEFNFLNAEKLRDVGSMAFSKVYFENLKIESPKIRIAPTAFANTLLKNVELNIENIMSGTFKGGSIEKLSLRGVKVIKPYAFQGNNIEELDIEGENISICDGAFRYNNIKKVNLKDTAEIVKTAFMGNPMEEFNVPDDAEIIE